MTKTVEADEAEEIRMGAYEVMFVLSPELLESKTHKKVKELEEMVLKEGGKITHQEVWEKRRLAYTIKKFKEGIYVVMDITCPRKMVTELNTHLRLDPEVLRHLVLTLPENYVYVNYAAEEARLAAERPAAPMGRPDMRDSRHSMPPMMKHTPAPMAPKKEADAAPAAPAKEMSAEELDKKLGDIIGGSDLNL